MVKMDARIADGVAYASARTESTDARNATGLRNSMDTRLFNDRAYIHHLLNICTTDEFRSFYLCAPKFDAVLGELAAEYHERCERFDRVVCSGPVIDGAVLPATRRERHLIGSNASAVRAEILYRAAALGYSRAQMVDAIARHA